MKKRSVSLVKLSMLASFAFMFLLQLYIVSAQVVPSGPDTIVATGKGRHQNNSDPVTIQAQAGNMTALVISNVRTTAAWQGYYGNVTGTITLDDANNQTLYDWSLPNPSGEIYASNGSIVTWSSIYCMNVSSLRNETGHQPGDVIYASNASSIELRYGINITDKDGLNETFNDTYADSTGFRVGAITIDSVDGCSMAHPYSSEVYATSWQELLLSDNTSIIFTSLIRENADSFHSSGETADFQMMVLENGHAGHETILTNYYFFVELT